MFHHIKKFLSALLILTVGVPMVHAFVTIEPFEAWQSVDHGYHTVLGLGGPANFNGRFRWNVKNVFYASDASFINYFGQYGLGEVDKAFGYYNTLGNFSSINPASFPDNTSRFNGTASALGLVDIRSVTMSRIANFVGLIQPDLYVWNLYNRYLTPNTTCPAGENYIIVQRNFDPLTGEYSSYVDGQLYTYQIIETCTGTPVVAQVVSVGVDPTIKAERAVADGFDYFVGGVSFGRYYTGLTKDDIGGLKTLMNASQYQLENPPANAVLITTNNTSQLLTTSDLATFLAQARTNPPATLQALYPGLNIISSTSYFTNTLVTNFTGFVLTNYPFAPAGVYQVVALTNVTTVSQTNYSYVFGNVQVVHGYASQYVSTVTDELVPQPFAPAGFYTEQLLTSTSLTPGTNGDFYIIPTNLCGSFQIVSTQAVTVVTNLKTTPLGVFNANFGQVFVLSIQQATYFTNYTYIANAINCSTNGTNTAVRGGIDKLTFIRHDYDSLFSTFWSPVTDTYQVNEIVGGVVVTNTYIRTVTAPDMLMSTSTEAQGPSVGPAGRYVILSSPYNYDTSHANGNSVGPGVINPQQVIYFGTSGGPVYLNHGVGNQGGGAIDNYNWGTFDGTTNTPIVYPSSASITALQNSLYFQITNSSLPVYSISSHYTAANPYSVQLGLSGGVAPFTWSIATNSPGGLPPNLAFTNISGVEYIQGPGPTNAIAGTTYDFYIQAKDSTGATAVKPLFMVINP